MRREVSRRKNDRSSANSRIVRCRHLRSVARAEFAGGQDGDGFGGPDAAIGAEFLDAAFAQSFQTAAAVVEQSLHERDGIFAVVAAADENGQKFGRRQGVGTFVHEFFARPIAGVPLVDGFLTRVVEGGRRGFEEFHGRGGLWVGLLVETVGERFELAAVQDATLPPSAEIAATVAQKLDEGGGNGATTHTE